MTANSARKSPSRLTSCAIPDAAHHGELQHLAERHRDRRRRRRGMEWSCGGCHHDSARIHATMRGAMRHCCHRRGRRHRARPGAGPRPTISCSRTAASSTAPDAVVHRRRRHPRRRDRDDRAVDRRARGARRSTSTASVIAPGFIDIHTHARRGITQAPTAPNYARQGVTTVIEGPDGSSPLPLAPFLAQMDALQKSINIGSFVGQGSVRGAVIGDVEPRGDARRDPEDGRRSSSRA